MAHQLKVGGYFKCKDPKHILPGAIFLVDGKEMIFQGRHGKTGKRTILNLLGVATLFHVDTPFYQQEVDGNLYHHPPRSYNNQKREGTIEYRQAGHTLEETHQTLKVRYQLGRQRSCWKFSSVILIAPPVSSDMGGALSFYSYQLTPPLSMSIRHTAMASGT